MGFNQRRMAREQAAAQRAEEEQRQRELGRDSVQAQKLFAIWNSREARSAAVVLSDKGGGDARRYALALISMPGMSGGRRGQPADAQRAGRDDPQP